MADADFATSGLFAPLELGGLTLANRLAVAPMTRVSAEADGRATRRMADYYAAFAEGGFGLVLTEGVYTDEAYAQGYLHQPGLANDLQRAAWRPVVEGVHARGGRIFAQLMHAGALSQGNPHRSETRGPSAIRPTGEQLAFYRGTGPYALPSALSSSEIAEAIDGFARSAVRAREAGFDGVEIHGANGYLLDQFLTESLNLRDDRYGESLEGRLRLISEVAQAVRAAVGAEFVIGLRISQGKVNDFEHKWRGGEPEAVALFRALGALPLDYLHTVEREAWAPAFGTGPSLASIATRHAVLPILANGSLQDPEQAAGMLARGEASFVSIGRGALQHPDWPRRVARAAPIEPFDRSLLSPIADLANADRQRQRNAHSAV